MKAFTIWQPWASLIASHAKPYEFRRWYHISQRSQPAVKVARPGKWGNPYKVGGETIFGHMTQTPVAVVDRYKEWIASDDWQDAKERRAELHKIRGKKLACWCGPGEPCHADVLLELANCSICEEAV